ncbi:hypothetical protein [Nocardia jejuensis]|uniref:hypothetical protein n=1 Tax=Nocardia jejuensis TaxID=328049 RepID=UPI000831DED9|nr:hypothetical protein [Nocardia jejuensis]
MTDGLSPRAALSLPQRMIRRVQALAHRLGDAGFAGSHDLAENPGHRGGPAYGDDVFGYFEDQLHGGERGLWRSEFRSQRKVMFLSHALVDPGIAYWYADEESSDA